MAKQTRPPIKFITPPSPWVRVSKSDNSKLDTCVSLIRSSTDDPAALKVDRDMLSTLIRIGRLDLWLTTDGFATLGFHSLGYVEDTGKRDPKFCICFGVDKDHVATYDYGSVKKAAVEFAKANQSTTRLYVVFQDGYSPKEADRIRLYVDQLGPDLDPTEAVTGTIESATLTSYKLKKV